MSLKTGNPASAATLNRVENVITDDEPTNTKNLDSRQPSAEEKIHEIAHWYLNAKNVPRPIVPYLKEKFGISAGQAAKAITKAVEWRAVR